jgi:dihydrofolate synthase/folylpolyglutamate synthase
MSIIKQTTTKDLGSLPKQRSYTEVVEFFDKNNVIESDGKSLERMKKLDALFSKPSQKLKTVLISGTNGKSLTAHFAAKLLKHEGLQVGVFNTPHILTYNERFSTDGELIPNKIFTDISNEVINAAQVAGIKATTRELLTQIAFNYFATSNVDVVILESEKGAASDATAICSPSIVAVTRFNGDQTDGAGVAPEKVITEYIKTVAKDGFLVSADQNKANLKTMQDWAEKKEINWVMPIRKLVALQYPFEQLHGRCAALAERIAWLFVNHCTSENVLKTEDSLLKKQKGQRGRPTLEAKKQLELNPKVTIEHFWKEIISDLSGRFQLLEKEKPAVLLDNAGNYDAFENLLLGIRLIHYKRPLKGLTLIVACEKDAIIPEVFAKQIRYFFKKTPGHIILCPLNKGQDNQQISWNIDKINDALKTVKVKARVASSIKEGLETGKKLVNDRNGLIVITGSAKALTEYWEYKGIKKLS